MIKKNTNEEDYEASSPADYEKNNFKSKQRPTSKGDVKSQPVDGGKRYSIPANSGSRRNYGDSHQRSDKKSFESRHTTAGYDSRLNWKKSKDSPMAEGRLDGRERRFPSARGDNSSRNRNDYPERGRSGNSYPPSGRNGGKTPDDSQRRYNRPERDSERNSGRFFSPRDTRDTRTSRYDRRPEGGSGERIGYGRDTGQDRDRPTPSRSDAPTRYRKYPDRSERFERQGTSFAKRTASYIKRDDKVDQQIPAWGSVARNGAKQIYMARTDGLRKSYGQKSGDRRNFDGTPSFTSRKSGSVAAGRNSYIQDSGDRKPISGTRRKVNNSGYLPKNAINEYGDRLSGAMKSGKFGQSADPGSSYIVAHKSGPGQSAIAKKSHSATTRHISSDLKDIVPARRLQRAESILANATRAYERDRFPETLSLLNSLGKEALAVPEVAELMGLALYRQGQWSKALKVLTNFAEATESKDQHPVLMDINRALGRHRQVEELFEELRQAGVSSDLMAEGRIVMAGDLADRGDYRAAIKQILPTASRPVRNPQARHIRQWFVLADLYERSGDVSLARELYKRVLTADPSMADIAERLAALS